MLNKHFRQFRTSRVNCNVRFVGLIVICFLAGWTFTGVVLQSLSSFESWLMSGDDDRITVLSINSTDKGAAMMPAVASCNWWSCYNPYRCGAADGRLTVYIYPQYQVSINGTKRTLNFSSEFLELIRVIRNSHYFEADPDKACLLLPFIDTLSLRHADLLLINHVLAALPWWKDGENHVLFNMVPALRATPDLKLYTGKAILAMSEFAEDSFRYSFDLKMPVFNRFSSLADGDGPRRLRKQLLAVFWASSVEKYMESLHKWQIYGSKIVIVDLCHTYNHSVRCDSSGVHLAYPDLLQVTRFCLFLDLSWRSSMHFIDALRYGCVPVVVTDSDVLPFHEVLDWKRYVFQIFSNQLSDLPDILSHNISSSKAEVMRSNAKCVWQLYFSSMSRIVLTAFKIIEDRIFTHRSRSYGEWNCDERRIALGREALFLARHAPKDGFTAVVLIQQRPHFLAKIMKVLATVEDLSKMVVIWNSAQQPPDEGSTVPGTNTPLEIMLATSQKATSRFLPYRDLSTEAILFLDEDVDMLMKEDIEFGYQVWREFPSCLVGYASEIHVLDSTSQRFVYGHHLTRNLSAVVSGAVFYHKFYNYLFNKKLTPATKRWLDARMDCEDIALNFVIANYSELPPFKVTPVSEFGSSRALTQHYLGDQKQVALRYECMRYFYGLFGGQIQLKSSRFQVAPVLRDLNYLPADMQLFLRPKPSIDRNV